MCIVRTSVTWLNGLLYKNSQVVCVHVCVCVCVRVSEIDRQRERERRWKKE